MDLMAWDVALGVFLGGGALVVAWSVFAAVFPGLTGASENQRSARDLGRAIDRIVSAVEEIRDLLEAQAPADD
ncbi:MAG TPA: hypothetical protein VJX71_17735 [Methylomirabilota bacterium]|nr:hypothetical protein [Methylomirabilota bacterium]